jgi:hypothetical protein
MSAINSSNRSKAEYWREVFAAQAASGKSICKFCTEHQINHHTFRYHRAKILHIDAVAGKIKRSGFIAVARSCLPQVSPRIALPNGVTIDLGIGLDSPSANQFLLQLCGVGLPKDGHSAKS